MRRCLPILLAVFLSLTAGSSAFQAGEQLKSGPQPGGEIPGPFHPLNVNGAHKGNPHCLVCEYGLDPVVLIFARDGSDSLKSLLQKLDAEVEKHRGARLHSAAVLLNAGYATEDTRRKLLADAEQFATHADLKRVVVGVCDPAGVKDYNLHKDADVTVLLYRQHKVVANRAFSKEGIKEGDINSILAAADKLATLR